MDNAEIMSLWQSYNKTLDANLTLNRKNAEDILKMKVSAYVASMKPFKYVTLVAGVVWVVAGGVLLTNLIQFAFAKVSPFFLVSAGLQLLLTAIAIIVYLYQLVLIHQVDSNAPVLETQERLVQLKLSTLWVTRILFLQLPLWTTFYLTEGIFRNGSTLFYCIQGGITVFFIYAAYWLFVNINYKNKDQKWFRLLFEGKEWTPVLKSLDLLSQLNEYTVESK